MKEFEVEIASRPLGVRFAHADRGETVVVHLVLENRLGDQLGLEPGDILVAVNGVSVLNQSSTEALDKFRSQELPYKATFRRYEDSDEFESDDENSDTEQTAYIRDEANHLMAGLAVTPFHTKSKSVQLKDWSIEEVQEWLGNYGRALGDEDRFKKYMQLFKDNNIDGKILRGLDRIDLGKMGIEDDDVNDLYVGIRELNNIIAVTKETLSKLQKTAENDDKDSEEEGDDDDDEEDDKEPDDEEDNWEAPFLPYMYDAPTVKLSSKTTVKVDNSRIVSPYGKKPFALYEIEVVDGDNEWLLSKRYTEFAKFHAEIKKLGIQNIKHKFPKKGLFKGSTDKKVMEERQRKLTAYLNCLLQDHPGARNSKAMNDFLSPSRTFVVDQ